MCTGYNSKIFKWMITALTLCLFISVQSCDTLSTGQPGALVPPTADEDPALPQIDITVAGHTRAIHLQAFGDPGHPAVFVLAGGPGADFKLLLPLKALADQYYVIMFDSRGAGLSERVTKEELSIDSFDDELEQVKETLVPQRKVALIGHSFGGEVMARYTARHPEAVSRLIMIEPGKLDRSLDDRQNGGAVSFLDGQDFFWQNELLTSKDHAAADYKAIEVLPASSRNWTCDDSIIENYPLWRFGAYYYYIVQKNTRNLPGDFNWASGIEAYEGPETIIAGTCGALSEDFQKKTNLQTLPQSRFKAIEGAGHITLFTDYSRKTVEAVRAALK